MTKKLKNYGWNTYYENLWQVHRWPINTIGRITSIQRGHARLFTAQGEIHGRVSGKLSFRSSQGENSYPVAGDWVLYEVNPMEGPVNITAILPRKNHFSRQASGQVVVEQIIAANLDRVFILCGLDQDFSPRRLQRYLTITQTSGIDTVIILNKVDVCQDLARALTETEEAAPGIKIHVISAKDEIGMEELNPYLVKGQTIAMIGSSGCGKSTLLNTLTKQNRAQTKEVRQTDGRGKHTTTSRSIHLLPQGALLIDNPGLREIQLWGDESSLDGAFKEIRDLAFECRFMDCRHQGEPGCAIQEALNLGKISQEQYLHFLQLRHELEMTKEQREAKRRKWGKEIARFSREHNKTDPKRKKNL